MCGNINVGSQTEQKPIIATPVVITSKVKALKITLRSEMVPDALLYEVPEMMDTPPILCSYQKPRLRLLFFI